jgi:hypothetical protein
MEQSPLVFALEREGESMKKIGLIFLIFLIAFLSACGASQRPALEQNRSLWESQAILHYRFNLKIGCNCPWYDLMPLTVEVKNGEIISMVASNGGNITPYLDTFRQHSTIESLFDTVDSAISRGVYELEVQYDVTYGFPTSIVINPSRMITDDETGYYVTDLEVLP